MKVMEFEDMGDTLKVWSSKGSGRLRLKQISDRGETIGMFEVNAEDEKKLWKFLDDRRKSVGRDERRHQIMMEQIILTAELIALDSGVTIEEVFQMMLARSEKDRQIREHEETQKEGEEL